MKPEHPIPLPPSHLPAHLRKEVASILIGDWQLQHRIQQLAKRIDRDHRGRDLVVVSLLTGTVMFIADLLRHLNHPLRLDFIGVSSYGDSTRPGELVYTKELRLDVRSRDVLVVDDILDTGRTLDSVVKRLRKLKPRAIRTCVLLDKPSRRVKQIAADYVGFEVPDEFVVGYGLDYAERYRNLPFIGVLKPEVYAAT